MLRMWGNFMLNIRCTCIKYRLMDTKNPAFIIKCGVPLQLVLYCPLGNDARKESSILSVHLATTPRFYGELTIPKSPDMLLKFLVTSVASSVASRLGDARPLARLLRTQTGGFFNRIGVFTYRWYICAVTLPQGAEDPLFFGSLENLTSHILGAFLGWFQANLRGFWRAFV